MDANDIIFAPVQIAELTETYLAERMMAQKVGGLQVGLPCYIPGLDSQQRTDDRGLLPLIDGELCSIIARPGNGKTSFMMRWARERVAQIRQRAAMGDEDAARRIVVYCTWEQTVEALHSFHVAAENKPLGLSITKMAMGKITDAQWEGIQAANVRRAADPLWFIGHSIQRKARRPVITVDLLAAALWNAEGWQGDENKFRIDAVFVDYLQRIPYRHAESKIIGISENLERLKDAALALGTKVIVGVQAKREVDQRDDPTPGMDDGQWTSNIEQTSDTVLTLVRPCKYKSEGETFAGVTVQGFDQMRVTVAKQKMGDANFDKWVSFDPRYNHLTDAEVENIKL